MKQGNVIRSSRWFRSLVLMVVIGGRLSLPATSALAAGDGGPCSASPESRQLDFWLGDWAVTYPGMAGSAASKVTLALDKCVVTENWDGGKGHSGTNMFAYSSDDKIWHGMFADNKGRVHLLAGTVAQGSAEFIGPSRGADGQAVLNRVKVVRLTANKVRQSWEKSTDNGVTWTMDFSGEYTRKSP